MISVALVVYVTFVNFLAVLAFRADKRRAERGLWRLSEGYLLPLALCGGWIGAKLAQHMFRHKTRKEPFRTRLNRIPAVWVLLVLLPVAGAALPVDVLRSGP